MGHGGCRWVMVVVSGSWRLCVCESREVSKDAIICQSTNDFRHPRLTLVRSTHRRTEGSSIDYSVL